MTEDLNPQAAFELPADAPVPTGFSVDRAVDEGMLIVRAALTMDIKNHIIVRAIRDGEPYDETTMTAAVRDAIIALAVENEQNADRVRELAADVISPGGAGGSTAEEGEGYRERDHPRLTGRGQVYDRMAILLRELCTDDDYAVDIAARARAEAWSELGDVIERRLLSQAPRDPDRFYDEDRDARIRALLTINLRALEAQARAAGHIGEDEPPIAPQPGLPKRTSKGESKRERRGKGKRKES